jgi:ribosomal protein L37AE/L43A
MALTRHKLRGADAVPIPLACEVCRERQVARLVANFIFSCDVCSKRISAALWHGREELALMGDPLLNSKRNFTTMKDNASLGMQKVKEASNGKNI